MKKNKTKKTRAPRKRTKATTGQREFINVCYLEREIIDGKVQVYGVCSCNTWRSSKEADTITKVGLEAKKHILASNGKCAFRFHEVPEDLEEAQQRGDLVEKIREELLEEDSVAINEEESDGSEPTPD